MISKLIIILNIFSYDLLYFFFFFFLFAFFFFFFLNFIITGRKRTRVSHSNSAELTQTLTFNNDMLLTNTPLSSTTSSPSSNDSAEISKEIKKMLDDRCSSSEFRDFVDHINLDCKYLFLCE